MQSSLLLGQIIYVSQGLSQRPSSRLLKYDLHASSLLQDNFYLLLYHIVENFRFTYFGSHVHNAK